jgi:hypothetical protein
MSKEREQAARVMLAALEACAEQAIAGRTMPDDSLARCEWYAGQLLKIRAVAKAALAAATVWES